MAPERVGGDHTPAAASPTDTPRGVENRHHPTVVGPSVDAHNIPGDFHCNLCGLVMVCPHTPVTYNPGRRRVDFEPTGSFLENVAQLAARDPEIYADAGSSIKRRADQIRAQLDSTPPVTQ